MISDYNSIGLVYDLIGFVISLPVSALILMVSTKIVKLRDSSYKTALKVVLIMNIPFLISIPLQNLYINEFVILLAGFSILVISYLIALFLIRTFYKAKLKETLLVWIIFAVIDFIFLLAFEFIMDLVVFALGFSL